jgi:hypothetical protein
MFTWLRKRRAITTYRHELGQTLRARHGRKPHYTPDEVRGSIRERQLDDEFHCFALAMYCEWRTFDAYHSARGESCDYYGMRGAAGCAGIDGAPIVEATIAEGSGGSWLDFFSGSGGDSSSDCSDGGGGDCGGDGGGGDGGGD